MLRPGRGRTLTARGAGRVPSATAMQDALVASSSLHNGEIKESRKVHRVYRGLSAGEFFILEEDHQCQVITGHLLRG